MSIAPPADQAIPPIFAAPADAQTKWRRAAVLPESTTIDVLIDDITSIAVNGKVASLYKTLPRKLKLVVTSVNTQFEHTAEHIPAYHLLEVAPPADGETVSIEDFWAVIYALHTILHEQETIPIVLSQTFGNFEELTTYLLHSGLARHRHVGVYEPEPTDPELFLLRGSFWQGAGTLGWHNRSWIRESSAAYARAPFPYIPSFSRSPLVITSHPLRPPKPRPGELLYRKYFPQYGQSFELHYVDLEEEKLGPNGVGRHLETFHRWHNDPWVHRGCLPVMMSWDGELMGYTELVYIRENHVNQYVTAGAWDYDRGLHCLIGEEKFRKDGRSTLWFAAIMHYLFLADPRTERLIGEPKIHNPGVIGLSLSTEMHVQTVIDLPYKRSALTWQTRERFFRYDLLIRTEDGTKREEHPKFKPKL
ncbi:unnamed protein product [Somion occarium]|uniref:Acyltransferase MbtK/IucB-like conserved domain-containing protein n=1 Tax=Somion occarium TaxID=3059160 RepID=A0ABP1DMM4_9APHY